MPNAENKNVSAAKSQAWPTGAPSLFSAALKLEGRRCLVVGAGLIAESKIESLVICGARVRVVAPQATEKIQMSAQAKQIEWRKRRYQKSDMIGAFLVVAATSSPKVHEAIFREARRRGVLCNVVDDPDRCDFYYPAVVRRGPLQIAISTSGRAPVLAQRLRRAMEKRFPIDYGDWVEQIGQTRRVMLDKGVSPEKRKELLRWLSSKAAFQTFRQRSKKSPVRKEPA